MKYAPVLPNCLLEML